MASAWPEEETFACPVCLDTLKDPATLPCGHSYCLVCIQSHWDKGHSKGQYSCPQCRQVFSPRPSLARSTLLVEAMEKLRTNSIKHSPSTAVSSAPPSMPIYLEVLPDTVLRQGSMYPKLPTVEPRPCPQHNRPLDLFCHEDKECVCEVCCQHGHQGHHVLKPQEERRERQKELVQMQEDVRRRIKETEKKLIEIPHAARQHKNFHIMEPLDETGATGESILNREEAVVASVRSAMRELQESIQELCKASLAKIVTIVNQDPVAPTVNGAAAAAAAGTTAANISGPVTAQNTVYEMMTDPPPLPPPRPQQHKDSSKSPSLHPAGPQASAPPPPSPPLPHATPVTPMGLVNPEPKTREEMLKFRFEPTMDPNTVYRHVQLSDGGRKATMRAENVNPADHPERFHFWRQVLCREPLAGSPYYWEVEWTGQKITIGVAYKEIERKSSDDDSRLGHNALSWSLYWSGTGFSFWHDGKEKQLGSPKARRIGVFLDQHAGILAFYRIANDQADLIHRHQSQFTGPLYPGFRFWARVGATVTICQLD